MTPNIENIPQELKIRPQWVCWRPDKSPVNPRTGKNAKANDPATWGDFAQAVKHHGDHKGNGISGIGYEFSFYDSYCGVDLDKCRDPETGAIEPWAAAIIDRLNSYTEISPSGRGVHILVIGGLPPGGPRRKGRIEMYDVGRFFTMTGAHISGTPATIQPRQAELTALHAEVFGKPQAPPKGPPPAAAPLELSDSELLETARKAKNGNKFIALYDRGDIGGYGDDDSTADLALCLILSFYTGKDYARIERLFNSSALGRRAKWQDREDYRRRTIDKAVSMTTETFDPGKSKRKETRQTTEQKYPQAQADTGEKTFETVIDELNRKHAVVMVGGKCCVLNEVIDPVFKRPDITLSSVNDFRNFYANKTIPGVDKHGKPKPIRIADLWLPSKQRREYQGIMFNPAGDAPGYYNLWRGLAVEPRPGDWSLMREHIWDVICGGNPEIFDYVMAWLADLFQKPGGNRPGVAIVLQGKQGTGKGIFANTVGRILGTHYLHISSATHLIGRFNHHLKDALLVFLDEAIWGGDKASEGRLKALITEDNELVEPKGKDAFNVKNFKRVIVSSNNSWIIPAGLEERRFLCLNVSETYQQDHSYFKAIVDQMEAGGCEAMLYDLLAHDYSRVNLWEAPKTEALFDQIVAGMTPIQKFWYQRLQDGWPLAKEFSPSYDDQNDSSRELSWKDHIPVERIYKNFLEFSELVLNQRHSLIERQFGRELRKLCPRVVRERPGGYGKRPRCYKFPPLSDCRREFQKLLAGYEIAWDNELD